MTSVLVMRNVTRTCAGTSMGSGANANIAATTGTTTLPSGRETIVGLANSGFVEIVVGSIVSTWLGGSIASSPAVSMIAPMKKTIRTVAAHIQIRSYRSTCIDPSAIRRAAVEEDEDVREEPGQREEQPEEGDDGERPPRMTEVLGRSVGHEGLLSGMRATSYRGRAECLLVKDDHCLGHLCLPATSIASTACPSGDFGRCWL